MTDHKKGIIKLLQEYFNNSSIKVIFLPPDDCVIPPPTDYLDYDPEMSYYVGYIIVEGIQIPFIAEVWPDDTTHIYLNPQKNFYLAHLVGELKD